MAWSNRRAQRRLRRCLGGRAASPARRLRGHRARPHAAGGVATLPPSPRAPLALEHQRQPEARGRGVQCGGVGDVCVLRHRHARLVKVHLLGVLVLAGGQWPGGPRRAVRRRRSVERTSPAAPRLRPQTPTPTPPHPHPAGRTWMRRTVCGVGSTSTPAAAPAASSASASMCSISTVSTSQPLAKRAIASASRKWPTSWRAATAAGASSVGSRQRIETPMLAWGGGGGAEGWRLVAGAAAWASERGGPWAARSCGGGCWSQARSAPGLQADGTPRRPRRPARAQARGAALPAAGLPPPRTAASAIMRPSWPPPSTPTTAVRGSPLSLRGWGGGHGGQGGGAAWEGAR
jgi:hypothetical protein